MNPAQTSQLKKLTITDKYIGTSFSLHRTAELGLEPKKVLRAAIQDLDIRSFRVMSYWNIHEAQKGIYDFSELDWQLEILEKNNCTVSLCLGKRQPRWPECHLPDWADTNDTKEWYKHLYGFIEATVNRYKNYKCIVSYQLENEALLKSFGHCKDNDYNRKRLLKEFNLVKTIDPSRPIIMTLSDSWGLPWRRPNPDMYGMTIYPLHSDGNGRYSKSKRPAAFFKLRGLLIKSIWGKPLFIHELQAEPWLDGDILSIDSNAQLKLMNPSMLLDNLDFASRCGSKQIDLWGCEWWYWLKYIEKKPELWDTIKRINEKSSKKYPYPTEISI